MWYLYQARSRSYVKGKEDIIENVTLLVESHSSLTLEAGLELKKMIENAVVCRGMCLGTLNRLVKLRKNLKETKNEVAKKY